MLATDNKYSQKQILLDMESIAKDSGANMRELFKPLIIARKVLTNPCDDDKFDEWMVRLKALHGKLDTDGVEIIYRVIAILFYKHDADISAHNHTIEDVLEGVGLDIVQYYDHYYNEEMQTVAIQSKAIEMLAKRNKILMDIAESKGIKPYTRIQALKALDTYINSCLLPQSPNAINVYGQTAIDLSQNKQLASFNLDKLMGQGDPDFRKHLKGKSVNGTDEIEEIQTIEDAVGE